MPPAETFVLAAHPGDVSRPLQNANQHVLKTFTAPTVQGTGIAPHSQYTQCADHDPFTDPQPRARDLLQQRVPGGFCTSHTDEAVRTSVAGLHAPEVLSCLPATGCGEGAGAAAGAAAGAVQKAQDRQRELVPPASCIFSLWGPGWPGHTLRRGAERRGEGCRYTADQADQERQSRGKAVRGAGTGRGSPGGLTRDGLPGGVPRWGLCPGGSGRGCQLGGVSPGVLCSGGALPRAALPGGGLPGDRSPFPGGRVEPVRPRGRAQP